MTPVNLTLPPITSDPLTWLEGMRKYHWRRSFECYAAELDVLADYHRKQAKHIERKLHAAKDERMGKA